MSNEVSKKSRSIGQTRNNLIASSTHHKTGKYNFQFLEERKKNGGRVCHIGHTIVNEIFRVDQKTPEDLDIDNLCLSIISLAGFQFGPSSHY